MSHKTEILALLPDNTTGVITPQAVRGAFDIVDPEQQPDMEIYALKGHNPTMKMEIRPQALPLRCR